MPVNKSVAADVPAILGEAERRLYPEEKES